MVLHHKNGQDHIHIGVNKITFFYGSMKEVVFDEIDGGLELIDSILPKQTDWLNKFCLMSVTTNANIGSVKELWSIKKNAFFQQFITTENDLIVTRRLETDFCMRRMVLGINGAQLAWHYTVTTAIPNDENLHYYSIDDVRSYFKEIVTKHVEEINKLMKGKPYDRYSKMQKHC